MHQLIQKTNSFIRNEDGVATAWAIGWLILCFSIAGLSIDITNAWKVKQFLQSTADVAAHAGGLELGKPESQELIDRVTAAASEYGSLNMNPARYGDVLVNNDVFVGYWDPDTKVFTDMNAGGSFGIPNAVRVITRQDGVSSSKVGTFFLRFVGFDSFTVAATATAERFISICEKDGLMSRMGVKVPGGNSFLGTYCVHGQLGINMANGNYFEDGTYVGMIDATDCGTSRETCTDEHNDGVENALNEGNMTFGKLDRLPTTIVNYADPFWEDQPEYITSTVVNYITDLTKFDAAIDLKSGQVNIIDCGVQGKSVNLGNGTTTYNRGNTDTTGEALNTDSILSKMVIVGENCMFTFDASIAFEDAIIATTAAKPGSPSFTASSNVRLGADDDCKQGGEVALLTTGTVKFAAKLNAYDLEILALGDVNIASTANELGSVHKGTNVWSGGNINLTTGQTYVGCEGSTDPTVDVKYTIRVVQ